MRPTDKQIHDALKNTRRQPRNRAPAVRTAWQQEHKQPSPEYLRVLEKLYRR